MMDKHFAALALALAGSAILAAGAYGWLVYDEIESGIFSAGTEQILPVKQTPSGDVQEMRKLSRMLGKLAVPRGRGWDGPADLSLFGYKPMDGSGDSLDNPEGVGGGGLVKHKATFAFVSGPQRFCVIDGKFLALGDELPSGMRIEQIETNRIRIARGGKTVWLELGNYDTKGKGSEHGDKGPKPVGKTPGAGEKGTEPGAKAPAPGVNMPETKGSDALPSGVSRSKAILNDNVMVTGPRKLL